MARLKLTNDHIDALEAQTIKAYHLLKKEIKTRGKCDLSLAVDCYHELKDSLVDIAGYSSGRKSFMSWNSCRRSSFFAVIIFYLSSSRLSK